MSIRSLRRDHNQGSVLLEAILALVLFVAAAAVVTSAVNASLDLLKSGRRRFERAMAEPPEVRAEVGTDRRLDQADAHRRVHRGLQELPDKYRTIVVLRDLEGRPYQEITEILSLPATTLKMRAFRGREMLAKAIVASERVAS